MVLANIPVTQTFELDFSILGVLDTIALSVVYDELLVNVEKLCTRLLTCSDISFLVNTFTSKLEAILICELPHAL